MKKILLAILVTLTLVACDDAEQAQSENKEVEQSEQSDDKEENVIVSHIENKALDYGAKVADIKVNRDANNEDEFLLLVTFKKLNKKDTNKLYNELVMYSDDLAASFGELKELNTVVTFWQLPNAKEGNALKRSYIRKDDKFYLNDEFKDVDIFGR